MQSAKILLLYYPHNNDNKIQPKTAFQHLIFNILNISSIKNS